MAEQYGVTVTLDLIDNVTKKLSQIEQGMERVLKAAQAYNTVATNLNQTLASLPKVAVKVQSPKAQTSGKGSTMTKAEEELAKTHKLAEDVKHSMWTLETAYKSIGKAQQGLTLQFKDLKKVPHDVDAVTQSFNALADATTKRLSAQKAFVDKMVWHNMIPNEGGLTALHATQAAIDQLTYAQKRMNDELKKGDTANLEVIADCMAQIEKGTKNAEFVQTRFNHLLAATPEKNLAKLHQVMLDLTYATFDETHAQHELHSAMQGATQGYEAQRQAMERQAMAARLSSEQVERSTRQWNESVASLKSNSEIFKNYIATMRSMGNSLNGRNFTTDGLAKARSSYNAFLGDIEKVISSQQRLARVMKEMGVDNGYLTRINAVINTLDRLKAESAEGIPLNTVEFQAKMKELITVMESAMRMESEMSKNLKNIPVNVNTGLAQSRLTALKGNVEGLDKSLGQFQNALSTATVKADRFNSELSETKSVTTNANSGINSLTYSLKNLAAGYLSVYSAKKVFDTSDSLILTEGKLSNLTDDVEGMMSQIYNMSQESYTSYLGNASQIAKMWQLTGGSEGIFDTQDKLLQFNEVLNKGFILGGSGIREINASLYQLTQALSSGRLQGDELRSLAENAPYLINKVTKSIEEMYNKGKDSDDWIKLTFADLRELGAQGVLTSDLIVDAVLNSTEEVREAYENLSPTIAQTWETIKNQAIKIAEPILSKINEIANSEAFAKTCQTIMKMFAILMATLSPVFEMVLGIGQVIADNWSLVEPVIWGISLAISAYVGYLMLAKLHTLALKGASLGLAVVQGIFKGLTFMAGLLQVALGQVTIAEGKATLASMLHSRAQAEETKQTWRNTISSILHSRTQADDTKMTWGNVSAQLVKIKTLGTHTKLLWGNVLAMGASTGATGAATIAAHTFAISLTAVAVKLYAIIWPVLAVVAAIALIYFAIKWVVDAYNEATGEALTMIGAVVGAFGWLYAMVWNIFTGIWNIAMETIRVIGAGLVTLGAVIRNIIMGVANFIIKAVGFIVGIFMAGWAAILNSGTLVWNGIVDGAEFMVNSLITAKNVIHNAFVSLFGWLIDGFNGIIKEINGVLEGINAVAGIFGSEGFGTIDLWENPWKAVELDEGYVDFSGVKGEYKDVLGEFDKGFHLFDDHLKEYVDIGSTFDEYYDNMGVVEHVMGDYKDPNQYFNDWSEIGDGWGNDMSNWWDETTNGFGMNFEDVTVTGDSGLLEGLDDYYKDSIPDYDAPNIEGSGVLPDGVIDAIDGINGNTSAIADTVSTSDHELELLRELAERKAINRFTTAEVKITNNMSNTINSEMDMDGVVNYLTEELNRALVAGSEAANHY